MHNQALQLIPGRSRRPRVTGPSLRDRSDDVLISIAILGLVASVSDGQADYREIEGFAHNFRKRFALSKRSATRLMGAALRRIRLGGQANIITCACDTLNEHLDLLQKVRLFDGLAEVLVADGKIHEGEEYFLDYVATKLHLLQVLEMRYPEEYKDLRKT